jgi:4-hydroxyphenylpyruvate dioxygenase
MLKGLFYVEFLVDKVAETQKYFEGYGLVPFADEQFGRGIWMKGTEAQPVNVIIREAISMTDKAKINRSGSCVTDIAFLVDDVDLILQNVHLASKQVLDMNVTSNVGLKSGCRSVQLFFPRPGLRHTLIEGDDFNMLMDGWVKRASFEEEAQKKKALVSFIDHIAIACLGGTLGCIIDWYEMAFNLRQKTGIITIKTAEGDGLRLGSLYHTIEELNETFVKLTFVESVSVGEARSENQVSTFLKNHGGPGVQHIAFLAKDIFHARKELVGAGVEFLPAPPGYYQLPQMLPQAQAAGISLEKLEAGGILFDNEPEKMEVDDPNAGGKYLLQVFTRSPFARNTCFFEIITRGNNREGFGAGNIRNLFMAVALEQKRKKRAEQRAAAAARNGGEIGESSECSVPENKNRSSGKQGLNLSQELRAEDIHNFQTHLCPVVVIGTSICGLTLSLLLAKAGVKVMVIGHAPENEAPYHLMGRQQLEVWERVGILKKLLKQSKSYSQMEVCDGLDGSSFEKSQEYVTVSNSVLRGLLIDELAKVSDKGTVRMNHEVVALGEVGDRMAVHVEPKAPLLAEFVIDACGLNSFWAAHLATGNIQASEEFVAVTLNLPNRAKPIAKNLQMWMNPWADVDGLFVIPLNDGQVKFSFPAHHEKELDAMGDPLHHSSNLSTKHLIQYGNFCSLLGLDKELHLEREMQELAELQAECDEIAYLAKAEAKNAKQNELMVVGLDLMAEQVQKQRNNVSRWWSPVQALPSKALGAVGNTVVRKKGIAEEKSRKSLGVLLDLEEKMGAVSAKMEEVRKTIISGKAALIRSMELVEVASARYLSRAVEGRVIYLVNNNVVKSPINTKLNEAIVDVTSLAWRLTAMLKLGADRNLLNEYEAERLFAAQVKLHHKQYFLRFFSPCGMRILRDAAQSVDRDLFSIENKLAPVNISLASASMRDWNSSLRPVVGEYFLNSVVSHVGGKVATAASQRLLTVLPPYTYVLLCFGVAPPADLNKNVVPVVVESPEFEEEVPGVLQIRGEKIFEDYQASEGTVILLRPDLIVEMRSADWNGSVAELLDTICKGESIEIQPQLVPKVPIWSSLSMQRSVFWVLFEAVSQFTDQGSRVEFLATMLTNLRHQVVAETDEVVLSKALISDCLARQIQVFELEDLANASASEMLARKSRKSSSQMGARKISYDEIIASVMEGNAKEEAAQDVIKQRQNSIVQETSSDNNNFLVDL